MTTNSPREAITTYLNANRAHSPESLREKLLEAGHDQALVDQVIAERRLASTSDSGRRSALERAVAAELATGGRLESQTSFNAVILHGGKINHVLHAILSLLTLGFWLIIWLLIVLTSKPSRVLLTVNEAGEIEKTVTSA